MPFFTTMEMKFVTYTYIHGDKKIVKIKEKMKKDYFRK